MKRLLTTTFLCLLTSLSGHGETNWTLDSACEGWKNEQLALTYFHNSELQRQWAWHLLGQYRFKGNERILDFGCGDGKISAELSHFVADGSVLGVDLSSCMVTLASRLFPPENFPNLQFQQAHTIDFNDELTRQQFDLICSLCVFHLIPNPIAVLHNLKELLTPEGVFLAVYPAGEFPAFMQAGDDTFKKYGLLTPWTKGQDDGVSMDSIEGCVNCLHQAGLTPISVDSIELSNVFLNRSEIINWLVGTMTANWGVPFEIAEDFFGDFIDRMAELEPNLLDESGSYHFSPPHIEIRAKSLPAN